MKITSILLSIFAFLLLSNISCNDIDKEVIEKKNEIEPSVYYVVAGIHDSTGIYSNKSKIVELNESGCLQYSGLDSIDIDNDLFYDFIFNALYKELDVQGICNPYINLDTSIIWDYWPTGENKVMLEFKNMNFEVACDSNSQIICFNLNDTIEKEYNWENNSNKLFYHYVYSISGDWEEFYWEVLEDRYLGIRKIGTDTVYGWLKLNIYNTVEIKEIYLQSEH